MKRNMLGFLRFIFAVCVIWAHFGPAGHGVIAQMAVFGFYLLSGFLMTRVLRERYRFDLRRFATNRFLRLYPIFWMVSIFAVVEIALLPAQALAVNPTLFMPSTLLEWLRYLTIVPVVWPFAPRPIPPSWSLSVEIINYALLFFVTARGRRAAYVVFALAVAYHVWAAGLPLPARYFPSYAAAIAFSAGALIYHERDRFGSLPDHICTRAFLLLGLAWLTVGSLSAWFGRSYPLIGDIGFYLGFLVLAPALYFGVRVKTSGRLKSMDRWIGDLSYPLFLCHYSAGVIVSAFVLGGLHHSVVAFGLTTAIGTVAAIGLASLSRKYIEPVRDQVRARGRGKEVIGRTSEIVV